MLHDLDKKNQLFYLKKKKVLIQNLSLRLENLQSVFWGILLGPIYSWLILIIYRFSNLQYHLIRAQKRQIAVFYCTSNNLDSS